MPRLSTPLGELADHHDVVVIGSGYGGAIAACRLARAGRQVTLLERGRERWPGEYPDTLWEAARELQVNSPHGRIGPRTGLVELHTNPEMHVVVGCGLGGTSLINANVSIEPEQRVWDLPCWPRELVDDLGTRVQDGIDRAWAMLRPTPYPGGPAGLAKLAALQQAAEGSGHGDAFTTPPINVAFTAGPNAAGVHQDACTDCGDCVSGCNVGAKTTTLMTYLPDAWAHGASIFTEISVRHLSREDDRWVVHLEPLGVGRERFDGPDPFITADLVVLAAGSLGSTEILLRSRREGLPLSDEIGKRFTGNGDVLGFSYDGTDPVHGVGWGDKPRRDRVGPTITGLIDLRDAPDLSDAHIVEEGAIPGVMAFGAPGVIAAASVLDGETADPSLGATVDRVVDTVVSLGGGSRRGALDHTLTYLVIGHDDTNGHLDLEDDRVRVTWRGLEEAATFYEVDDILQELSAPLGGRFVRDPLWRAAVGESLITTHPLGGCAIGSAAETGVVDHRSRVFSGPSGSDTYDSLFVMDGSIMPTSLGVNPLVTISGLAERACLLLCEARNWPFDDELPSDELDLPEREEVGLRFTETMHGTITPVAESDESDGSDGSGGQPASSELAFTVTIEIDDVEALFADRAHPGRIIGTVTAPALDDRPLSVMGGTFRLFDPDPKQVEVDHMEYRLPCRAEDGRRWLLQGTKTLEHGSVRRAWDATTTLDVTLHELPPVSPSGVSASQPVAERDVPGERTADPGSGTDPGPVVATGQLELGPLDLARQLRTMDVVDAPDAPTRLRTLARFGRLFAGDLLEHYGGVVAPASEFDPESPARRRRDLDAPVPEVRDLRTEDGVALRLTRYRGGSKGPVLVVHGAGVSSAIFSTDLPDRNLVEGLVERDYDVWLLDYRASIALPASTERSTADQVAEYDHPAAVAAVLEATGASSLQALVHCYGANTFVMSMLRGWTRSEDVRSLVCSQVATHLETGKLTKFKAGLHASDVLDVLGVETLTAYTDADSGWRSKLLDTALRLNPVEADERCTSEVCHRITFLYGLLYEHDQLDQALHDGLHELFGVVNIGSLDHLAEMVRAGHVVNAKGEDVYLGVENVHRLALPTLLLSGRENRCYRPPSLDQTYELLREVNGAGLYERLQIDGYGHIDCIFGKRAWQDVHPAMFDHLDAYA